MRTALAVLLTLLAAAPAAQAAPAKVTWPAERPHAPGERIAVTVSASKAVTVSIQRVTASGKVMQTLARRSARRATVAATLKSAGRYAVRVGSRSRAVRVADPVPTIAPAPVAEPTPTPTPDLGPCHTWPLPPASTSAELRLGATSVRAGESLPYELVNTSPTGCLTAGAVFYLQRLQGDGSWAPVVLPYSFPMFAVLLSPGGTFAKSASIPADAEPGTYRLIDVLDLATTFEVLPGAAPVETGP